MSKILVTYFSASGITQSIAKMLAEVASADIYEIKPQVPYTREDLNWNNKQSRSTIEMDDKWFRPPIADKDANIKAYDTIFIGFPIWWYIAPTIINTFLESYDFAGKTIVVFATSGSSGFGKTIENLQHSVDASTKIIQGILVKGSVSKDTLASWANEFLH